MKSASLINPTRDHYYRIIPSHFPPIELFETIYSDPEDLAIAYELESLTNPRLRAETGDINILPKDQWRTGPGTTPIMAAFTHIGYPSRFTDGSFGVYYAGDSLQTAIAETSHHRAIFLAATNQPDQEITMRAYSGAILDPIHDLTPPRFKTLHDPNNYTPPQTFAKTLKEKGSNGLLYHSVRHQTGKCVAIFNPNSLAIPKQRRHLRYQYSQKTKSITQVLEIKAITY